MSWETLSYRANPSIILNTSSRGPWTFRQSGQKK